LLIDAVFPKEWSGSLLKHQSILPAMTVVANEDHHVLFDVDEAKDLWKIIKH